MAPDGWARLPLEEVGTLQRGFDLPVQDRRPGHIPVVASNGPVGVHDSAPVKGPGVVTGRSGTIGKVFYYKHDFWPLNTTLYVSDFHANHPQFIALLLTSLKLERFVAATGVPSLNRNFVHPLPVLVPPLAEQRKIAAILSSVDDAIETSQAVIDQLQVVKKAMMAELLTKGLPGRHKKFKQTEIGDVPEEWSLCPLADVVAPGTSVTYGIVQAGPHVEGGVPYIKTGDVKPEGIDPSRLARTSPEIASRFERSCVRTGDLVFCIRASVGAVARIPSEIDGANLTQGTARIAPGPAVDGDYLLWALRSPAVQSWVDMQCKGSTFREITLGRLRELPVPVASAAEQAAISCALTAVEIRIRNEAATYAAFAQVKSALMSVLLTGEVRVRVDEEAAA